VIVWATKGKKHGDLMWP